MRHHLLALSLLSSAIVAVASAQSTSGNPSDQPPHDFATAKAQHFARLEKELACIQAAATPEAMHACMPQHPGGHMGPPPAH